MIGTKGTVYIKLLHGRDDPQTDMEQNGFEGPTLGPFDYVHFVYTTEIHCGQGNNPIFILAYHEDMIEHDGKFYGDMEIATWFGGEIPQIDTATQHDNEGRN